MWSKKTVVIVVSVFGALWQIILFQHILYLFGISIGKTNYDTGHSSYVEISKSQSTTNILNDALFDGVTTIEILNLDGSHSSYIVIQNKDYSLQVDEKKLEDTLHRYDVKRLLVPFGGFIYEKNVETSSILTSTSKIDEFLQEVIKSRDIPATNAEINVSSGDLVVTADTDGLIFPVDASRNELLKAAILNQDKVSLRPEKVVATRTKTAVEEFSKEIIASLSTEVEFNSNSKSHRISSSQALLPSVIFDDSDGSLDYTFPSDNVSEFLRSELNPVFGKPAVNTYVDTTENGNSTTTTGKSGLQVQITDEIIAEYLQAIKQKSSSSPIAVGTITLEPSIIERKSYSKTQSGFDTLVSDLGKKYSASISVSELFDGGRSSSYAGSEQKVAASTYKLIIAYYVGQKISSDEWKWTDRILDKSIDECFDLMLRVSNNTCPQEWIYNVIGSSALNSFSSSLGLSATCFNCGYTKSSTNDQISILKLILQSDSISNDIRDKIINTLKSQIYRSGIPAATSYAVADKPGFIESYKNDTAIVYTARGPVLLSIYTNGRGWSAVKDIAEQIIANSAL